LIIVIDGGILAKESKIVEERSVLGVFGTVQKGWNRSLTRRAG